MAPPATAVNTGTDYGNVGPQALASVPVAAEISPQALSPAPEAAGLPAPQTPASPAGAPGGAANPDAYNPASAQPYTAPEASPVTPLPQTQLGPDTPANGAVRPAGAVAYGLDQILRGFMRGRAQNQATQAIQLQKQSSGLQKNLDMASQQYYTLAKAGTDPASPQMQSAKQQVDAAWQANMDFMKQHVAGEQIDKKTGQLKPQQAPLLQRLTNGQDPAAQALAVYQGAQALGPPVYHQAASFLTPQYQAYAKTQAQTAGLTGQNALVTQQTAAQKGALQTELNTLNAKKPEDLSDADVARRDQLGDILGQPTEANAARSALLRQAMAMPIPAEEPARSQALAAQARLVAQINSKGQGAFTPTARLATAGSFGEQLDRVAAEHHMTRAQLPPDVVEAYRQRWAWDNHVATSTTRTGVLDTEDPVTHQPTKTPISLPGGSSPGPRPGIPGGWGDPAEAAIPSDVTHPVAVAAGTQAYTRAINGGYTPAQAKTVAKVASSSAQRSLNVQTGTPIPTNKNRQQTADETKAYEDEGTIGKQLTVAETAAKYPTAASDATLGSAFAKAQIGGRLTNFDLQRFNNLGSARMRMEGTLTKGIDGTMTDEQRKMLLDNMRINYQAAHGLAENYRKRTGVGQYSSTSPAPAAGAAPSADDLENLFQKAKSQ